MLMDKLLTSLSWTGKYFRSRLYWRWKFKAKNPILGRYACLGQKVLGLLQPSQRIINVQAGRIDYLVACWKNPSLKTRALQVFPYETNPDVIYRYVQLDVLFDWLRPACPTALFMDSFAELAYQQFIHRRQGWRFLAEYKTLLHSDKFERTFRSDALIPTQDIDLHFTYFFTQIRSQFGGIPIFYLHFPIALESREKFQQRYDAILSAVDNAVRQFPPFYSLSVDNAIVDWPEEQLEDTRNYPYHYNRKTYETFAEMVRATGAWPG